MNSAGPALMKWFRGNGKPESASRPSVRPVRSSRRSTGLAEFTRILSGFENAVTLDMGPTSPANFSFLTGFGQRVCNEDILHASRETRYLKKGPEGTAVFDQEKFFRENLNHPQNHFDAVLCWDVPDYLAEPLVKPMMERLHRILKPKGVLLAFFHTKEGVADSAHCRYHIVDGQVLELEPRSDLRVQRVFNNRHVENLFQGFASLKFFLARENVREVLAVR